jgi:uncharacterized protein YndB with AHSA1/START domain
MPYDFEVADIIPASCEEVFRAWISSDTHAAMTGGEAVIDPRVGGKFTAWDGYISGTTIELEPFSRIVQSWRTSEFEEGDDDSQIEVTLTSNDGGTLLTIRHTSVPDDQRGYENGGWLENYFVPMRKYFASE